MEKAFKRLEETKEKIISESNSKKNNQDGKVRASEPINFAMLKDKLILN